MNLKDILFLISSISKKHGISKPYLCGGAVRDKVLNKTSEISDIDITTGDETVNLLSKELSKVLPNSYYKDFPDGHSQITMGSFKLDFSSNFKVKGIEKALQRAGIKNPTELQAELFSRDFTCNALLMELNLKTILDPTGLGIKDINNKMIRTCLPAAVTLGVDNKRIVRVIYLAAKLGFEVDKEIIDYVKIYPDKIANCKPKYLKSKLQEAINYDIDKTVKLLNEMNLWKFIPILPELIPYMGPEQL